VTSESGRASLSVMGSSRTQSVDTYDQMARSPDARPFPIQEIRSSNDVLGSYAERNTTIPNGISGVMSAAADIRGLEASTDLSSVSAPLPPVPLFEHFIIIGASMEVCIKKSGNLVLVICNATYVVITFRLHER
jgi:hypothetical protein